jgi:hypothetical protein
MGHLSGPVASDEIDPRPNLLGRALSRSNHHFCLSLTRPPLRWRLITLGPTDNRITPDQALSSTSFTFANKKTLLALQALYFHIMRSVSPAGPAPTEKPLLKKDHRPKELLEILNKVSIKQLREWTLHLSLTPDGTDVHTSHLCLTISGLNSICIPHFRCRL